MATKKATKKTKITRKIQRPAVKSKNLTDKQVDSAIRKVMKQTPKTSKKAPKAFVKRAKVAKAVKAAKKAKGSVELAKALDALGDELFKATPKQLGKAAVRGAKAKPLSLQGICFEYEQDTNFENNVNFTFVNAIGAELNDQERTLVQAAIEKVGLDVEPIMKDVYSGDFYNLDYLERELVKLGAMKTCLLTNPTDVMAIVREQEAQDAADRKAGQSGMGGLPSPVSGCGNGCASGTCPDCDGFTETSANPADYYFNLDATGPVFIVTSKACWDKYSKTFDDTSAIESALDNAGFEGDGGVEFDYPNGTPQAGRALLLSLGFIENTSI